MDTLYINKEKCTECGKCQRVCPAGVFERVDKRVSVVNANFCIECSQCVAVCGDGAVEHPTFTADRVHRVDYSLCPSPESLMELLCARRSRRTFKSEPVPEELLLKIAEAAHLAPTAQNLQRVSYTIITNKDMLRKVTDTTMGHFIKLYNILTFKPLQFILKPFIGGLYAKYVPSFKKMIAKYESGADPILKGATALILIHTPRGERFAIEDSNLAYQNGSLMAESLDVAHFYTGFVLNVAKAKKGKFEKLLGIDGVITAGMALGLPQIKYAAYCDKKPIKVEVKR
ncbi:MAG: nitroreductase family protein [Rikenellaceae bacterium]